MAKDTGENSRIVEKKQELVIVEITYPEELV